MRCDAVEWSGVERATKRTQSAQRSDLSSADDHGRAQTADITALHCTALHAQTSAIDSRPTRSQPEAKVRCGANRGQSEWRVETRRDQTRRDERVQSGRRAADQDQ